MCSPPETTTSTNNNRSSEQLINNHNRNSITDLQSNQQDNSPDTFPTIDLDFISSPAMPFPAVSSNQRGNPSEVPSAKAYNNKKGSALVIGGQDRFATARSTPSNAQEHKLNAYRTCSPISSTSDIWADPSGFASPSTPLDYLRDIDLTPCTTTTLSTLPSRTPSEEDHIDDPWRISAQSLEIPDLEQPMTSMNRLHSPTAVAREPTNPFHRKVNAAISRDNNTLANRLTLGHQKQRQVQSRSAETSREAASSTRRDSSIATGSSVGSTLQRALKANQNIRQAQKDYYERPQPHQLYAIPHATMEDQYYYNQQHHYRINHQPQQQTRHLRLPYSHEPRSPHSYKLQVHGQPWVHSPHSQATPKNISHQPTSPSSGSASKISRAQHPRTHSHTSTVSSSGPSAASGARPTYEILKTLLRKKACLYEPGTSKAIALITWLVGRKLALSHGYFSRQHLQSGVHAVVADKIDSGMITRTKVNRCMQIILNSCFHYIIPRPDGSEENGDLFREIFAENVLDDSYLLKSLPEPWHDLEIKDESLLEKEDDEEDFKDDDKTGSKRVVLLCFNENVRSAEDVLRCHNDFIRDAAISGKLNLSADEWRHFFLKSDDDGSRSDSTSITPPSPVPKAKGGCDLPYLTFDIPLEVSRIFDFKNDILEPWSRCTDALGQMNSHELNKFRTHWCCKRYDHDHSLCRFAHVDVNEGWLRRDPSVHSYGDQRCAHTTVIKSATSALNNCHLNTCPNGLQCSFAHSQEEINYHPRRYKSGVCDATKPSCLNCKLRDICPKSHPESPRSSKSMHSTSGRRSNEATARKGSASKQAVATSSSTTTSPIPMPSPIIFHKPAPISEFEKTMIFPGLQSLYRRNCAMTYAHFLGKKEASLKYSNFGDNWNDEDADDLIKHDETINRCFSLYSTVGRK